MSRATVLVLLGGLALTAVFVFSPGPASSSAPFLPGSDSEVLEEVPRRAPRASATPLTEEEAVARAQQLLDEARRSGGDGRLLGRAQATLTRWWAEPAPPPRIRMLRATLKQRLHDFEGALADLDAQVAADPLDAQAWLARADVLVVLARAPEAEASCAKTEGAPSTICRARVMGLQGRAKTALAALDTLQVAQEQRARLLSVRGELEHWSGDDARAEGTLAQALALDPDDTPTRLLLAQLWLDTAQRARAAEVFEGRLLSDAELLLLVLSLEGTPAYAARRAELDERMAASRQRGETLQQREESRYALALEGDVPRALLLATKNWAVQKAPADARALLEAAVAAKDRKAAEPVLRWLTETNFAEPRLLALAKQLETP